MGCTKFGENWEKGPDDLLVDAAYEAYQDAGIDSKDIQAAWFGTTRLGTAEPMAAALKFDYIPVTRVENLCATATEALRNACFGIASGVYDIVLAIGVEKLKDQGIGGLGTVTGAGGDGTMEWGLSAGDVLCQDGYPLYASLWNELRRTKADPSQDIGEKPS